MLHLKLIRKAVVLKLKEANIPDVGNEVFPNRPIDWWPEEKAGINVYLLNAAWSGQDREPRLMQGRLQLTIEVM